MAKQLTLFTIYIPFQFMLMTSHQQDMTLKGGWLPVLGANTHTSTCTCTHTVHTRSIQEEVIH